MRRSSCARRADIASRLALLVMVVPVREPGIGVNLFTPMVLDDPATIVGPSHLPALFPLRFRLRLRPRYILRVIVVEGQRDEVVVVGNGVSLRGESLGLEGADHGDDIRLLLGLGLPFCLRLLGRFSCFALIIGDFHGRVLVALIRVVQFLVLILDVLLEPVAAPQRHSSHELGRLLAGVEVQDWPLMRRHSRSKHEPFPIPAPASAIASCSSASTRTPTPPTATTTTTTTTRTRTRALAVVAVVLAVLAWTVAIITLQLMRVLEGEVVVARA